VARERLASWRRPGARCVVARGAAGGAWHRAL